MKKLFSIFIISAVFASCAPDKPAENNGQPGHLDDAVAANVDEGKGIGEVKNVPLTTPLDQDRVKRGKAIYDMKCSACHKLNDQRVVGPGWAGITERRKPEWIMNMITNVDVMLAQDAEAQKLLELCLVRMPNQNVSIGDARDILEFMRENDGVK
ncbi:MAG TPA: cytochrome c [Chryseosolibacter sp.]|nr:cytochrome c [Chryseosolibacter sp.]